jgi:hypothetical protein
MEDSGFSIHIMRDNLAYSPRAPSNPESSCVPLQSLVVYRIVDMMSAYNWPICMIGRNVANNPGNRDLSQGLPHLVPIGWDPAGAESGIIAGVCPGAQD